MPKKCCVVGCRSGYENNKEKFNIFKFPSDEDLKMKWLIAIGRKDYKPSKWSAVCHKHFREDDIIRHCVGVDPETGTEALFPIKVNLKDEAIPAVNFDNSYQRKSDAKNDQTEVQTGQQESSDGPSRVSENSSSDEDLPLETLKNQCLSDKTANTDVSPAQNISNNPGTRSKTANRTLKRQFIELLDQYEQLKDKHVALGQEIDVLEKANIELKCKVFKF